LGGAPVVVVIEQRAGGLPALKEGATAARVSGVSPVSRWRLSSSVCAARSETSEGK
jgi:hypothetical protein